MQGVVVEGRSVEDLMALMVLQAEENVRQPYSGSSNPCLGPRWVESQPGGILSPCHSLQVFVPGLSLPAGATQGTEF